MLRSGNDTHPIAESDDCSTVDATVDATRLHQHCPTDYTGGQCPKKPYPHDVRGSGLIQSPGVVKSVEKKESVAGQFAVKYKSETYCWTQKLIKEDYGSASPRYFLLL